MVEELPAAISVISLLVWLLLAVLFAKIYFEGRKKRRDVKSLIALTLLSLSIALQNGMEVFFGQEIIFYSSWGIPKALLAISAVLMLLYLRE